MIATVCLSAFCEIITHLYKLIVQMQTAAYRYKRYLYELRVWLAAVCEIVG